MKILIVEDEHRLSDNIRDYLAPQGYLCEQAFDYNQAKMMSGSYDYDCVLLDLMLPGGSGLDVLKAIRKKNMETGVIIISAKDSLDDKLTGLRIGADDYLPKPFALSELAMRVYALIRRKQFKATNEMVSHKIKSLQPMWQSLCVDKAMTFSLDTSTLIYCNETLLESLLNNLVVNAIRHCKPQGEIVVTLKNNSLKVENASDGMPLDGEKIFSRFYRGDVSKGGASQKGNGLGLAIVKSICDYHHWTVSYAFEHGNHCFRVEF